MSRSRRPRLLEVCPFEWEAVVRRKGTNDPPTVIMLSRGIHGQVMNQWFVYVDKPRETKLFDTKDEAFDYVNREYEAYQ
jgi:hypothetical protein